ncbi:hypothetical protein [Azotobacter chroococcum]|uniref:hypothetical protein n=1 Tax=Azotobacter chroococcum TaxID=353 RepID=UPI0010ADCB14|nr:hypothetical protein [Azotobacter chroococcum]TKD45063.1 hypothetical protein FCG41_04895 [Azotobacter chroococcum]
MLNLNTIREQDKLRHQLAQATADYLAAGGTIDRPASQPASPRPTGATLRKIAKRHRIALPSGKGREAA